jgi:hypothetical protein
MSDFDPKIQLLVRHVAVMMKIASNITFLWIFLYQMCEINISITISVLLRPQKDVLHINIGNLEPKIDL